MNLKILPSDAEVFEISTHSARQLTRALNQNKNTMYSIGRNSLPTYEAIYVVLPIFEGLYLPSSSMEFQVMGLILKLIAWSFQDKVNYYTSELHISRMAREKQKDRNRHHLFNIEAFGDYDYHHNFFEGAVNRDMKFWEPELVRNYTKKI